jgi:hypothetical protein
MIDAANKAAKEQAERDKTKVWDGGGSGGKYDADKLDKFTRTA